MATRRTVKRKLDKRIEKVSGFRNPIAGRIGATPTLIDTGIPGLIYVRIEGSGQIVTAVNSIAPAEYNHPVLLARSRSNPSLWEVIASRQAYTRPVNRDIRYHHTQHEYPSPDTVWVRGDQFLPFLVLPNTTVSAFNVQIYGGVATLNSVRHLIDNQTFDASPYVPSSGAIWLLLEINSSGIIDTVVSTSYASKELLVPENIPLPDIDSWDICAIRLYAGQERIRRDTVQDILDLRWGPPGIESSILIDFLDQIGDVDVPNPTDGQVLTWNEYAGVWVAETPTNPPSSDTDAYHQSISGEIEVTTEKTSPVAGDVVLGENSQNSFSKIRIPISSLPGYQAALYPLQNYLPDVPPASPGAYDDEFDDDTIDGVWVIPSYDSAFNMLQTNGAVHVDESIMHGNLLVQGAFTGDFYKPFTPSASQAFTLVTKISVGAYMPGGTETTCIFAIRGNADNVFYEILVGRNNSAGSFRTVYANGGGAAEGTQTQPGFVGDVYLMIVHDGSKNFSAFVSGDGLGWSGLELNRNLSNLSSFTRLSIFTASVTVDGIMAVDFIRYFTVAGQYKIGLDV